MPSPEAWPARHSVWMTSVFRHRHPAALRPVRQGDGVLGDPDVCVCDARRWHGSGAKRAGMLLDVAFWRIVDKFTISCCFFIILIGSNLTC